MPKISVIIPIYNVKQYLSQCLNSVVNQTFKDIEIICVNDGSTDDSAAILQTYCDKDNRIKVITQENKGLSAARNAGLNIATSDYISFIDSDDFVHPQFLESLYNAITKGNCDISGCDFAKIQNNTALVARPATQFKIYPNALNTLLDKKNFIHFNVWNKLYKRSIINDFKFIEGIYYEDWVFNTCVFAKAASFAWINSPLYGYRMSDNSIMRSNFNIKKLHDYETGIKEVYKFITVSTPNEWNNVKQTRIARTVKTMMNSAIRSRNKDIMFQTKHVLQNLYHNRIIGYKGLAWHNKIKFLRFLL